MSQFLNRVRNHTVMGLPAWEKGLTALTRVDLIHNEGRVLVVLVVLESKRKPGTYHCHRYFKIGNNWEVSVDRQGVPLAEVWIWLSNPKAKPPVGEAELDEPETPATDFFPKGMENFHENGGDVLD